MVHWEYVCTHLYGCHNFLFANKFDILHRLNLTINLEIFVDYRQHLYYRNMCYFGYLLMVLYSFNLLLCHHPISLPGCLQFQQSVHKGHRCSKGRQDTIFPAFWKGTVSPRQS